MTALSILHQLITPERHHLIEPGALLSDLLPYDETFAHGLAINLETELGLPEFSERVVLSWRTVGDVLESVGEVACG